VKLVRCDEETLQRLLLDIDAIEWPGQPEMAGIAFVRFMTDAPEQERPGDLWQTIEVWANERLVERGLEAALRAVR